MIHILGTIVSYLLFNLAIWVSLGDGGLIALGAANLLGASLTVLAFRGQIREQGLRPKWPVSLVGSVGILVIVSGLRGAHSHLPPSMAIEMVYNLFAVLTWPMFRTLYRLWPRYFKERPGRFDLVCHGLMALLVLVRVLTYGPGAFTTAGVSYLALTVAGYMLFNVSVKLAEGHRATNVVMNVGGGLLLGLWSLGSENGQGVVLRPMIVLGAVLGGLAIFGIVRGLGASYTYFGQLGKASLVPPLVYDGILVASPLIMPITGERLSVWTFIVASGMLAVTIIRYGHHMAEREETIPARAV